MLDKALQIFNAVYGKLSVVKTLELGFLILLVTVSAVAWEAKTQIAAEGINVAVSRLGDRELPVPSEKTQEYVQKIVDRSPQIIAIQFANMNFKMNERRGIFFYSSNPHMNAEYNEYQKRRISASPLWIVGDEVNNTRIIKIVNTEFVCVPVPARVLVLVPAAARYATTLCSISVPPYFGKVMGWVSLWLIRPPTQEEVDELRIVARTVSLEFYERDIKGLTQ